jgi:hypothetical protein
MFSAKFSGKYRVVNDPFNTKNIIGFNFKKIIQMDSFLFIYFFFRLGFELRASHLQSRHSST